MLPEQAEPEEDPSRDQKQTAKGSQRAGPLQMRIERENIEAARKEDHPEEPADDAGAPGRAVVRQGKESKRMDPLLKEGGAPKIEMVLAGQIIVNRAMRSERTEYHAEESEDGPETLRQAIRGRKMAGHERRSLRR